VLDPLLHAKWAVEDLVADTPAATLTGLRLQVLAGLQHLDEDFPDSALPQIEIRVLPPQAAGVIAQRPSTP
jgi:hypothetical protein